MMRTGFIFVGCWWLCNTVFAQGKDSVTLPTVTVRALPDEKYLAGSSVQALDSSLQASNVSKHLGEVLSLQFPVYFRNYGSGMLSGISMRGTSPQHTAVLWNGINITSFSLGQADFSILPVTAFDEVKIHEGAGSARFGSGAFGGTVLLNSTVPTNSSVALTQEVASFGRFFTSVGFQSMVKKWGFKTKLYDLNSKNDFVILSTGERQQHAGLRQSGILQDIQYKWSDATMVSLHYWFHDADRNIQPAVGAFNAQDTQQDRNHRLSIRFQDRNAFGLLSLWGGYVYDAIVFDGSKGSVGRWIGGGRHEFLVAHNIHVQLGAELNHIVGRIPNYEGGVAREDRYDFTASIQKDFGQRLSLAVNLRQPKVKGFNAPFLPYLGADYLLIHHQNDQLKLRGSISKNYRIPTLNDRYWQDAGNKNLLPETTRAAELGLSWRRSAFEISSTAFAQRVDQWIQWLPGDNAVYRPHNIKQVLAEGVEAKISYRKTLGQWTIMPQASYQYTRSITTEAPADQAYTINKQLIYTPRNTASGYLQVTYQHYFASVTAQYSGKRFTESSNLSDYALPAFALMNIAGGRSLAVWDHCINFQLSAKNIFNLNYQLYSGYALPGRNYAIQLTYQLTTKAKSNDN